MKKSYLMIAISMILVQGCYTAPPYEPSSHVASVGYSGVNIGIHYSTYPDLVRIPGYPVYYAPRVNSNFFFYDGLYWVFQSDNWYASSWYNGPWDRWVITMCRFICCASRFATTASLRRISAAGMPTRRHVGGITGVATGNSVEAGGTVGTAAPPRLPHRCRLTSGIIPATAILAQ